MFVAKNEAVVEYIILAGMYLMYGPRDSVLVVVVIVIVGRAAFPMGDPFDVLVVVSNVSAAAASLIPQAYEP